MGIAIELDPFYEDSMYLDGHAYREQAERAYRHGYLTGALEASQWFRPDLPAIERAWKQRLRARNQAEITQHGLTGFKPDHVVLAARTRGRQHAMEFVRQAWGRPEAKQHDFQVVLQRWMDEVIRWAAQPIHEVTLPPNPDDDWPHST